MTLLSNKTKKLMMAAVASVTIAFSPLAHATIEPSRIAVVDVQQVVNNSSAAKKALDEIQKKRDAYQDQIDGQEKKLKKQDAELAKQKSILSAEAFEEKRQAFKKEVLDVQRDVQEKRKLLDRSYAKVLTEIQNEVLEIIAKLAEDEGFDVALPTSQILYAPKAADVSDAVLKRLNKQLPSVSIETKE